MKQGTWSFDTAFIINARNIMKRAVKDQRPLSRTKRRRAPTDPLDVINAKSDDIFIRDHLRPSEGWTSWKHPKNGDAYTIILKQAGSLLPVEFQACFDLIEQTSGDDYRASAKGWNPSQKKDEMRSPELRYVLVKNHEDLVCGFTSLMPTWEEGLPVVYCYEIHLQDELHGTGLGKQLFGILESVAKYTPPIEKIMLTVFLSNERARTFYTKLGFTRDETSPEERRLRSGRIVVPDYEILSRTINRESEAEQRSPTAKKAP